VAKSDGNRPGGDEGRCRVFTNTFNFTSIGLASQTNDRTGGQVAFVFTHADFSSDTSIVTLKPGVDGLQHFSFDEENLTSVQFFGVDGKLLQFDELGLTQPPLLPIPRAFPAPSPVLDFQV
jgi:hypothetical protein